MWPDLILSVRITLAAVALQVLLPLTKLPRLVALIESRRTDRRPPAAEVERTIRLAEKIGRFRYFLIRNNCLKKGLLLYYFLVRAGVKGVRLYVGVDRENGELAGHCWLRLDGRLLNDTEAFVARYAVMYTSGV